MFMTQLQAYGIQCPHPNLWQVLDVNEQEAVRNLFEKLQGTHKTFNVSDIKVILIGKGCELLQKFIALKNRDHRFIFLPQHIEDDAKKQSIR